MLANEILAYARDTMLGFDSRFLPLDGELLDRLSSEIKVVVDELIRLDRMGKSLPDDANQATDVSVFAASYTPATVMWRVRQIRLNFATGRPLVAGVVPSNNRHNIPKFQPSLYFQGSDFFPIDGAATLAAERIYSWSGVSTVEFDYVDEPLTLTDGTDTVGSPDEAKTYLGHFVAHFMAVRGKVAEATLREIKTAVQMEKQRMLTLWIGGVAAEQVG